MFRQKLLQDDWETVLYAMILIGPIIIVAFSMLSYCHHPLGVVFVWRNINVLGEGNIRMFGKYYVIVSISLWDPL